MRYIVVCLLFANVLYFLYLFFNPAPVQEEQARELLDSGLMLLSEFDAMSVEQARGLSDAERLCSIASGFADMDQANDFLEQSRATGFAATLVLTGNEAAPHFRVYLAPATSAAEGAAALEQLDQRLAEEDLDLELALIRRGPLANAVTMGTYPDEASARVVQSSVFALGYTPLLEEIPRSDGEVQVWLRPSDSGRINDAQWLDLSAESPELTRSENLCETIAQASQFP